MITTIKVKGESHVAIILDDYNEADVKDFAQSLLDLLSVALANDEVKDLASSACLYMTLQLYQLLTPKTNES